MKKSLLVILALVGIYQMVAAQQEPQYTQYMFNQLAFNPAYAGSRGTMSGTLLFRKQWWGFEGAPVNANISLHKPSANEQHGFGVNFTHDRLGVVQQNFLELSYAYQIEMGKAKLSLGLSGGFTNYSNRFSDVTTRDPDQIIPTTNLTAWLPRVGTGAYFRTENFFVGASTTNLLSGKYFRYDNTLVQEIADKQRVHLFATMGGLIPLDNKVDFRPSTVMKYVHNAPVQFDFNATFFFSKTFGVGAGYRTGDAVLMMLEYISPKYFRFGYAFDYSLNPVQSVSAGSHEFMVGMDISWGRSRFLTPRFF